MDDVGAKLVDRTANGSRGRGVVRLEDGLQPRGRPGAAVVRQVFAGEEGGVAREEARIVAAFP